MRTKSVVTLVFLLGLAAAVQADPLRICLDFFPNPNHVPLYVALEALAAELDVEILVPGDPSDPVKLAAARAADVCLTPQMNYLIARSEGLPLVAVGALIGQGLGGLLALSGGPIASVADLAGKRIGYSLEPLEPLLWRTMLRCAGVSPNTVQLIPIGFNTVASLLAGSVDAIGAFRNFEPIEIDLLGRPGIFFAQEAYCVPETYELLFAVHPDLVAERPDAVRALLRAVADAVDATRADPDAAFAAFLRANPDLDDDLDRRAFAASLPLYADGARHDDAEIWDVLQTFLAENGIIGGREPIESLYRTDWLPQSEEGET
ncbi:MAG: ABC transporter substrate-binding protein [Candidatus Bipolaricaulis sp.]|nr:ABC transporter substrate-binding protein [Candidatus Bipolaricaulis sp.]MDD5646487.1 ABC transporter substrate-binding protein [Candidatus Bipolaricaulis sp.]